MTARVLLLLLWAGPAFAQHPCDRPEVASSAVMEGTVRVSVCYAGASATWGTRIGDTIVLTPLATTGAMNAEGLREFTGHLTLTRGTYQAAVLANGISSPAQTLTVKAPTVVQKIYGWMKRRW